jgi:RNA polymerase sigma-70 factor (ECF subfamily)
MLDVAVDSRTQIDLAVRAMLVDAAPKAHRLAAWILHDPAAAEDAVQEAALLAWHNRGDLRDPDSADGWFTRILVNVCRAELRRRARPRVVEAEAFADGGADRLSQRDELSRSICTLTADEQTILALRFGRDLTVPQIAAAMGLREGTVKSRLHTALEHMRAALEAERRIEEALR